MNDQAEADQSLADGAHVEFVATEERRGIEQELETLREKLAQAEAQLKAANEETGLEHVGRTELAARHAQTLALLRKLMYRGQLVQAPTHQRLPTCIACGKTHLEAHTDGCELTAALR